MVKEPNAYLSHGNLFQLLVGQQFLKLAWRSLHGHLRLSNHFPSSFMRLYPWDSDSIIWSSIHIFMNHESIMYYFTWESEWPIVYLALNAVYWFLWVCYSWPCPCLREYKRINACWYLSDSSVRESELKIYEAISPIHLVMSDDCDLVLIMSFI